MIKASKGILVSNRLLSNVRIRYSRIFHTARYDRWKCTRRESRPPWPAGTHAPAACPYAAFPGIRERYKRSPPRGSAPPPGFHPAGRRYRTQSNDLPPSGAAACFFRPEGHETDAPQAADADTVLRPSPSARSP